MAIDPDVLEALIIEIEVRTGEALKNLNEVRASMGSTAAATESALQTMERRAELLEMVIDNVTNSFEKSRGATIRWERDLILLQEFLDAGTITLKEYKMALAQVNMEYLKADTRGKRLVKTLNSIGRTARRTGRSMTLWITTPLAAMGVAAVKEFAKFDQAIIDTQTLLGETPKAMEPIREAIKDLSFGGTVAQGPEELAGVMDELVRSGRDASQSMEALNVIATFSTATNSNLEKATKELAESQEALGLASDNSAVSLANLRRISNLYAEASRFAQTEALNFAKAINNQAGPTLRQYNIDIEEGLAVLAAYAKQGTIGSEAGTFQSRAYLLLSKAANTAADAHEKMGFKVFDAADGLIHLSSVSRQLTEMTKGLTDEQTAALLKMLGFEQRSQRVILPLIGMADFMEEAENRFRSTGEVIDEMAKDQMEALSKKLTVIWNKIKVLAISLVEKMLPAIEGIIDKASEWLDWWDGLSGATQNLIVALTGILAVAGPTLIVLGGLATATAKVVAAFRILTVAAAGVGASATAAKLALIGLANLGVAVVTTAIIHGTAAIIEYVAGLNEWMDALEKIKKLNKELADSNKRQSEEQITSLRMITDADKRKKKAEEYLKTVEANKKNLTQDIDNLRAQFEEGSILSLKASDLTPEGIDTFVKKYQGALDRGLSGFTKSGLDQLLDIQLSVHNLDSAKQAEKELRELISKTNEEIENRAEKEKEAAEQAKKNQEKFEELQKAQEKAQEQTAKWKSLQEALIATYTSLPKAAESIRQSVLTPQEKLNEKLEMLDSLLKNNLITWETYSRAVKKAGEEADKAINKDFNDQVERGKQLMEEFATPQEQFNKRMKELSELRKGGFIDFDTFRRAAEEAKEALDKELGNEKVIAVRFRLADIEGIEAGSAEAARRLRKQAFVGRGGKSPFSIDDPFQQKAQPIDPLKDSGDNIRLIKDGINRLIELEEELQERESVNLIPADIA